MIWLILSGIFENMGTICISIPTLNSGGIVAAVIYVCGASRWHRG